MWTITTQKNGASALGLQRVVSYQTAWPWMHKLRRAMVLRASSRSMRRGAEEEGVI